MRAGTPQVTGPEAIETLLALSDLETQIARFYERLAEMFEDNPDVGEFWLQLAEEELAHAEALRYAAETLPVKEVEDPDRLPLIEPEVIAHIETEIKLCEASMTRHEASLEAAFRCALFLESAELNHIYPWLLNKMPLLWTETLRVMSENPGEHLMRLCRAIEQYSQDHRLRQQAQQWRDQWEEYAMK